MDIYLVSLNKSSMRTTLHCIHYHVHRISEDNCVIRSSNYRKNVTLHNATMTWSPKVPWHSWPAEGPDSRASLVTAFACTLIMCMSSSGFRSAGFIYIGIMKTMGVSRGEASWPISLIGAVTNLSGCISGPLCQLYSPRPLLFVGTLCAALGMILSAFAQNVAQLTVTMGVIYGFGNGVILTMVNIFITQHFDKYRAAAFGVVYAGSTMASVIFPALLLWLNGFYAFNWILLILGGILLNMTALAISVREPRWLIRELAIEKAKAKSVQSTENNPSSAGSGLSLTALVSVVSSATFLVLLMSNVLLQWAFDAFMTTLVDFAIDKGSTLEQAVDLLPWFSLADVIGRVVLPVACDKGLIRRPQLITVAYLLCGVGLFTLPLSVNYTTLVCGILFMGVFMGTAAVLFSCIVGDFIGLRRLPLAFAVLGLVNGCFFFLKPRFFGYFRDEIQSYDAMFWVCAGLVTFTGLVWVALLIHLRVSTPKEEAAGAVKTSAETEAEAATLGALGTAAAVSPMAACEAARRASLLSAVSSVHSQHPQSSLNAAQQSVTECTAAQTSTAVMGRERSISHAAAMANENCAYVVEEVDEHTDDVHQEHQL